jgi:hypothetical protein
VFAKCQSVLKKILWFHFSERSIRILGYVHALETRIIESYFGLTDLL